MAIDNAAILAELDSDQLAVVKAITGPVCVIAGAGTGKTRVITNRIAYAINAGVTDPTKVLALTFTAKAAGEMRARLRALGISNASARTFHSAALKQLLYFWPYAFGGQFPSLLTTKSGFISQAITRAEVAIPAQVNALREIASEIEWAKVSPIVASLSGFAVEWGGVAIARSGQGNHPDFLRYGVERNCRVF